jgi:hypothetical protein
MLIFTCEGPRNADDDHVVRVYREHAPGRYCPTTLTLDNGRELSGLALKTALDALEAKLADKTPPPMAA